MFIYKIKNLVVKNLKNFHYSGGKVMQNVKKMMRAIIDFMESPVCFIDTIEEFVTDFMTSEKGRKCVAVVIYFSFIIAIALSSATENPIATCISTIIIIMCELYCVAKVITKVVAFFVEKEEVWKHPLKHAKANRQKIINETRKLIKEFLMFIPMLLLSHVICSLMTGIPENQAALDKDFYEAPIWNSILMIILGPMLEEYVFRYLPNRFIKNSTLYIIFTSLVFAWMHVSSDPNPFYYIWVYMSHALYYGYRYRKTQDIKVTLLCHSFNNLIATLPQILSLF